MIARRRRARLRDLGHPRPRRLQRRARVPRPHRRQPRQRAHRRPATPPPAGGTRSSGPGRAIDTDRWFVVCVNVLGGCQGSAGPAHPHPDDRRPWGSRFPVVTDPRHGAHPGRGRRPPGREPVGHGHRRLDGRHAGARVGGDVPGAGALDHPHRHVRRRHRPADRLVVHRPSHHPHGPGLAGRRLLRRRPRRRAHRGPGPGPDGQPDHLPHRRRVHRPLRPRRRRPAPGRLRAVAALRGRALPRVPRRSSWCAASTPTATCCSPRRWTSTTSAAAGVAPRARWRATAARCSPWACRATCSTRAYQSREIVELARRDGSHAEYVEIESLHGHDAFLIEIDQVAEAVDKFLTRIGDDEP